MQRKMFKLSGWREKITKIILPVLPWHASHGSTGSNQPGLIKKLKAVLKTLDDTGLLDR